MGHRTTSVPLMVSYSPVLPALFALVLSALIIGFVLAVFRYRETKRRGMAIAAISLGLVVGLAGAGFAYGAYQAYVVGSTWHFSYYLDVQANDSASGSLILPIPKDEGLVAGLHLDSGQANWSLVTADHGRGLFVQLAGRAILETSVSLFPPPATPPDTSPTTMVSSNCTAEASNCSWLPSLWIYSADLPGVLFVFCTSGWCLSGSLRPGWALYELYPPPVAALSPRTFL